MLITRKCFKSYILFKMSNLNNSSTPVDKNSKRLGLRRSIKKTAVVNTPKSDIKIDYKSLQQNADSLLTPITRKFLDETRSTNCRPYRLSLNKNISNKYKKKKLEFSAGSSSCPSTSTHVDNEIASKPKILDTSINFKSNDEMIEPEIEVEELKLKGCQEHERKVKELKDAIEVWKRGFQEAIQELSTKTEIPMDNEQLLEKLGIPQNMIKYLE